MSSEQRLLCESRDDALDATIASLVVRARVLGLTRKATRSQLEQARVEGWIHVPTCDLAELAR